MPAIAIIDPRREGRWDLFVKGHPGGTIFHASDWANVICSSYRYEPRYYVMEDERKNIAAGAPFFLTKGRFGGKRLICLPFTDSCDVLGTSEGAVKDLYDAVLKDAKEHDRMQLEVRDLKNEGYLDRLGFTASRYYKNFLIELEPDFTAVTRKISRRFRRYVRNVSMTSLFVRKAETREDMDIFYRLNLITRRRHGVPPQPRRFFTNIWDHIIARGNGFLLIAYLRRLPISACIYFISRDTIFHKYTASDYRFAEYHANHLLVWNALEFACRSGLRKYDFGRTAPDNSGLVFFKQCWGATQVDMPYSYWPRVRGASALRERSPAYRVASNIVRMMPFKVLSFIGENFYQYLA